MAAVVAMVPLILGALTVTAIRWAQPDVGWALRIVAMDEIAGRVLAFSAVVVVISAIVLNDRWRRVAVGLVVLSVIGLLAHEPWKGVGGPDTSVAAADELRVLSFNSLFGSASATAIADIVRDNDVDVAVIPEITDSLLSALAETDLTARLPYHVGRTDVGTQGTMIFAAYPLVDSRLISTGFDTWKATLQAPNGPTTVLGVHLRAPLNDARSWRDDLRTLDAAAEGVDIMAGDFNATLSHRAFDDLLGERFQDVDEVDGGLALQGTWPRVVPGTSIPTPSWLRITIDHVLIGPDFEVAGRTRIIEVPGSDHSALLARVAPR